MKFLFFFSILIFFHLHPMQFGTMLHLDCYWGDFESVQRIIDGGCDVNRPNQYGITPLMMAVQMQGELVPAKNYYEIVIGLISIGAKPELKTKDGRTALDLCVQNTGGTPEKIAIRKQIITLLENHMANAS